MRKGMVCAGLVAGLMGIYAGGASAATIDQYASSVIGYSSQWSTGNWSAEQVLGAPNTNSYGDIATSWAPAAQNGTSEYITVGFDTNVYASGVTIRETDGNGFVYQVDVLDLSDVLHTVWTGIDPSAQGTPVDFQVGWTPTSFLVKGVKVYTDTRHSGTWEEIDSIQLHGDTEIAGPAAVPTPAASLGGMALLGGLAVWKRRARRD